LDDVSVSSDIDLGISLFDIPDLDGEVVGGGGEDVVGSWVEVDGSDLSLVSREALDWGSEVGGEALIGDVPDLGIAIFGAGGDEVLVEGVELNVKNIGGVTADEGDVSLQLSGGVGLEDGEGTTTSSIPNDTNELCVGSDLVGIPSTLRGLDTVVSKLSLGSSTKDVAVLGRTNNARCHFFMMPKSIKKKKEG